MARKRGFFAEAHHRSQVADQRRRQASAAASRSNAAAERQLQRARRLSERAQVQLARASAADQKQAQHEAQRLHDEAMSAEAKAENTRLAEVDGEIDSILGSALARDPFVALEELRQVAQHPPFAHTDLRVPVPPPVPVSAPPEPRFEAPPAPKGLGGIFGKKKQVQALAGAQSRFAQLHSDWEARVSALPTAQLRQMQDHQHNERRRLDQLAGAEDLYRTECEARDAELAPANAALDQLIRDLQAGVPEAVHEYVDIVLGNSEYPESFGVEHDFVYDAPTKELSVRVTVPPPTSLAVEKEFRYVKAKNKISPTTRTMKEQKDRYATAVYQVALRTLHEVFVADRDGYIQTIALTVDTESIDAATGLPHRPRLVAVAAERSRFLTFDLGNVVPLSTLQFLGALVSKSPFDLVGVDDSKGVRRG